MRLRVLVVALALAAAGWASAPAASASPTSSGYAARLADLVNEARAQAGVPVLSVVVGTTQVATAWTQGLAAAQALSHNPHLAADLAAHGSPDWTVYGENVGEGSPSDPDGLFRAYMASPEHRSNVLDPRFRYLGIAARYAGGVAWNTMDFVDRYAAPAAAPAAAPPAAAPAPRPAATSVPVVERPAPAHPRARAVPVRRAGTHRPPSVRPVPPHDPLVGHVEPVTTVTENGPAATHLVAAEVRGGSGVSTTGVPVGLLASVLVGLLAGGVVRALRRG